MPWYALELLPRHGAGQPRRAPTAIARVSAPSDRLCRMESHRPPTSIAANTWGLEDSENALDDVLAQRIRQPLLTPPGGRAAFYKRGAKQATTGLRRAHSGSHLDALQAALGESS